MPRCPFRTGLATRPDSTDTSGVGRVLIVVGLALTLALVPVRASASPGAKVQFTFALNGKGTVTGGPRRVECRGSCTRSSTNWVWYVKPGSTFTLKARAAREWKFAGWRGACRGSKPTCVVRVRRSTRLSATFVPPGAEQNPIPLGKAAVVRKVWRMTVRSVTPNANDLVLAANNGDPFAKPPPGAQDYMVSLSLTYIGGGSSDPGIGMIGLVETVGSHGKVYDTNTDPCPGSWPDPSLKNWNKDVFSGQTVTGNICYLIAANDAASLRLFVYSGENNRDKVWFALR